MTQDEIIEMARQAGDSLNKEWLVAFAKLVAAKEREACARLCEEHPDGMNMLGGAYITCAKAIRARGEQA